MEPIMNSPRSRWVPALLEKGWVTAGLALAVYLSAGLSLYLHTYKRIKPHHVALAAVLLALILGFIYLIWAALWAFAGRVFRHRAHFTAHLSIPLLATLIVSLFGRIVGVGLFALDMDDWTFGVNMVLQGVVGLWVLFAHLHLVSEGRHRNLFIVALLIVVGFCGLLSVGVSLVNRYVSRRTMTPLSLYPPVFMVFPAKTVDDYLKDLKSIQAVIDKDAHELSTENTLPK